MIKANVVERTLTEWTWKTNFVLKKDYKLRFCASYRRSSTVTQKDWVFISSLKESDNSLSVVENYLIPNVKSSYSTRNGRQRCI